MSIFNKHRTVRFIVSLELPEGARPAEAASYIDEAVKNRRLRLVPPGCGDGHPESPMALLNPRTVRVRRLP